MMQLLESLDWNTVVVAILSSSVLSAVILPHINWGIERRRQDRDRRLNLLESWLDIADKYENQDIDIIEHSSYKKLRQYLSVDAIDLFETRKNCTTIVAFKEGASQDEELRTLLEEIERIEKLWKVSL